MKFAFVSNYINHHQIPFCEAMRSRLGSGFRFIQTEPMEEERRKMGWGVDLASLPYVSVLYGNGREALESLIQDSDIALFGWTDREDLCQNRLEAGKPVIRESERLYREGQWKAVSPRGLIRKHHDHTRWRDAEAYLLCNGAYVASDFDIIRAYPGKKYRWGYFPDLRTYTDAQMKEMKKPDESGTVRILWAGRFLPLKHPEFALDLAAHLKERGARFHLDLVGGGEMEEALKKRAADENLSEEVTFHGFLPPGEVRGWMERAHIFLFTSNHLEGWGAVLNEAMNSGCAVIAGSEAGAVPFLIEQGVNGLIYNGENEEEFLACADYLFAHPTERHEFAVHAQQTIGTLWNADTAAERLLSFSDHILTGKEWTPPADGPMSRAEAVRPFPKYRIPDI